ncbi:hypothetical protein [Streptomyces sp. NPDC059455]|uniref:hypothetical protein n=1 Tax=Streptomyces sp. NPDC059455 TaxID=3346837 RepID=UPI00368E69DB
MTTAPDAQGRDWTGMRRADFDDGAPLALMDADTVARPVLAVPDQYGTEALFGDEPTSRRATRSHGPAHAPAQEPDTLFTL